MNATSPLKETGCNNKNPPKTYHVSRPVKRLIFQNATKNRGLSGSSSGMDLKNPLLHVSLLRINRKWTKATKTLLHAKSGSFFTEPWWRLRLDFGWAANKQYRTSGFLRWESMVPVPRSAISTNKNRKNRWKSSAQTFGTHLLSNIEESRNTPSHKDNDQRTLPQKTTQKASALPID